MKLFVFDFDNTITSDHTHNRIMAAIDAEKKQFRTSLLKNDTEKQWDIIKTIPPIGNSSDWKNLFENIIESGNAVAIASYNAFGEYIIPRYLKEIVGLPENIINMIRVESWLPAKDVTVEGKNQHIANLLGTYEGAKPDVILIDDSEDMITAASNQGYFTILADLEGSHIAKSNEAIILSPIKASISDPFERLAYKNNIDTNTNLKMEYSEQVVITQLNEPNQPTITFKRDQKEIYKMPDVGDTDTVRDVIRLLESSNKVSPSTRTRYNFFVNNKDIHFFENIDKSFHEVVKESYDDRDIPQDITIEIKRKS